MWAGQAAACPQRAPPPQDIIVFHGGMGYFTADWCFSRLGYPRVRVFDVFSQVCCFFPCREIPHTAAGNPISRRRPHFSLFGFLFCFPGLRFCCPTLRHFPCSPSWQFTLCCLFEGVAGLISSPRMISSWRLLHHFGIPA